MLYLTTPATPLHWKRTSAGFFVTQAPPMLKKGIAGIWIEFLSYCLIVLRCYSRPQSVFDILMVIKFVHEKTVNY